MTKRWFIYKEDQPGGPYTAAEIRQLLRDGSVDPFDFVSQEGSQFKQELVEVDEIFSSDNISYEEPAAAAAGFSPQIAERSYSNKDKKIAPSSTHSPQSQPPGQVIALASDMRRLGKSENLPVPVNRALPVAKKRKRDPKKYHLIDPKGRVLGPLSPGEIQSLYYRGVVDKNVKVMRDGSNSVVQVSKFVSAYAQAQGVSIVPKQGAHPQIHAISKSALNRMAMMRRAEQVREVAGMAPITVGILGVAALLLVITVALIIKDGTLFKGSSTKQPKPRRDVPAKVIKQPKTKKIKVYKKKTSTKRPSYLNPIRVPSNGGKLSKPKRAPKQATKVKPFIRSVRNMRSPVAYTPPLKRKVVPFYTKPKVKPLPKPVYKPPIAKNKASSTKVKPAAVYIPKPAAKPSGPTVGGLVDGRTVSGLGPMSFSRDAVKSCDGSCTVSFSGAGGTVSVAFFKNVWGPKLLAKSGGVYISGLVRKSGGTTKILLSGVK